MKNELDLLREYYRIRERLDLTLPYTNECGKLEMELEIIRKQLEEALHI